MHQDVTAFVQGSRVSWDKEFCSKKKMYVQIFHKDLEDSITYYKHVRELLFSDNSHSHG